MRFGPFGDEEDLPRFSDHLDLSRPGQAALGQIERLQPGAEPRSLLRVDGPSASAAPSSGALRLRHRDAKRLQFVAHRLDRQRRQHRRFNRVCDDSLLHIWYAAD